jgi:chemotaxis protein methyltransferase CheR
VSAAVSPLELSLVSAFVHEASGIVLDSTKDYLVQSRLGPLLQHEGVPNYAELIRLARADATGRLTGRIVDAVATNETSFFRDHQPFDLLAHKLVPDVLERQMGPGRGGRPRLDIWSAAAATGQEVYSIAIVLKELLFDLNRYWIRILGTDISEHALAVASRGWYSANEAARGLTERRLQRFFVPDNGGWRIVDELRAQATFAPLNLTAGFPQAGLFDIIFCRNVAIYFSTANRRAVFNGLAEHLRPEGVLLIGSSESLIGVTQFFVREEFHGVDYYRKSP